MKNKIAKLIVILVLCHGPIAMAGLPAGSAPDLVLLVVVDQLRGDMPRRFQARFGDGGFRYLAEQGTRFHNAQYRHANTLTAAGHATLMTGGNAPQHGLVANEWYDAEQRRPVYCMADADHRELGVDGPLEPGATEGRSPRNLAAGTFGDKLVLASGGRSRVFAVSLKDRSAIIMAGRVGKAFWYSTGSGGFVTSTFYYERQPAWMRDWNASRPADRYAGAQWSLLHDRATYVFAGQDDRPWERFEGHMGRTFPHPLGRQTQAGFYSALRDTPMADELTLGFVRALVAAERPGQRGATDLLAVSFSATDYIGHAFGPFSLEAEDNLLRLDRTLSALFDLVDREVGLERTLVVLASDHGIAPIPELMAAQGFAAERHDPAALLPQLNRALRERFGVGEDLALAFRNPGMYLDPQAMARLGLDPAVVEHALAEEVVRLRGFRLAFTRTDLLAGRYPATPAARRVAAGFHPSRSGNVIVVPDVYWYLDKEPQANAAMHGSLYTYDTHVPLMLAGPGIGAREVYREVAPRDLAPTISAYLGIAPPSAAIGSPLEEVLR